MHVVGRMYWMNGKKRSYCFWGRFPISAHHQTQDQLVGSRENMIISCDDIRFADFWKASMWASPAAIFYVTSIGLLDGMCHCQTLVALASVASVASVLDVWQWHMPARNSLPVPGWEFHVGMCHCQTLMALAAVASVIHAWQWHMPAGNSLGVPCWHVSLPNVFALASIAFVTSGTSVLLHLVFSLRQPVSRVSYRTRRTPAAKCSLHRARSRKEGILSIWSWSGCNVWFWS